MPTLVDITTVVRLAASVMNVTPNAYGVFDTTADPLHPQQELLDAADMADKQIINAILNSSSSRHRGDYLQFVVVTSGSIVTGPLGGVKIDGLPGKPLTPDEFWNMSSNRLGITTNLGYYTIVGRVIWFTGAACSIETIVYTPTPGTLQSPAEYEMAVVVGILAQVFAKEGAYVEAADYYGKMFLALLELIEKDDMSPAAAIPFVTEKVGDQ